ncbi:MAG: NADH-quinone oxidoreductase subunit M [Saprospirales bacterium]|nr:NADH-quinone oxidoreductase subunit M [Saprospirales bacterium]
MSILLLAIPFLTALAILATRQLPARRIALSATLANLVITIWLLTNFNPDGSTNYALELPWVASAGIHLRLGLDGISMLMLLLTNLLAPLIVYASFGRDYGLENRYYGLVLFMTAALNGVFMALDGLLFYIFYELALIPIYFICAIWGGENRIRITLKFFIYTFIGSLFMLVALLAVYFKTPGMTVPTEGLPDAAHSFAWEDLVAVSLDSATAWWVMLGFFLAFAVKMPVFPFHTWQPDTYVSAPTGGAMLLSGIMLKMGVYGMVRWMVPLAPEALHAWAPVFLGLAVTGIVYASIIAIKQTDLKRLIAYSSIVHVGLIAAGILVWNKTGVQGGMVQMLNHGINVVGLFFIVDMLERRLGSRSLLDMGGIAKSAPRFAALFMIVLLGSIAVPLTNGFVGEFLLLNGVWNYNNWLGAAAGLTVILGAVYMLRAYGLAMFGEPNRQTADFVDVSLREWVVLGTVAGLVILLGFFPQIIVNLTDSSVNRVLGSVQF